LLVSPGKSRASTANKKEAVQGGDSFERQLRLGEGAGLAIVVELFAHVGVCHRTSPL
jgi:hypothetical protein